MSDTPIYDELCLERTPLGQAKTYSPLPEEDSQQPGPNLRVVKESRDA